MTEFRQILEDVNKKKKDFYKENSKTFFRGSLKQNCAQFVANNMDLQKMIEYTAMIIPNTNIIYYNYLLFKTYANKECSDALINHVFQLINRVLEKYETFEFHINLKTFTVSACQRYYPYIHTFFEENKKHCSQIRKIVVYHTPSIIQHITTLLYSSIREYINIVEYVYKDSDARIANIFQNASECCK